MVRYMQYCNSSSIIKTINPETANISELNYGHFHVNIFNTHRRGLSGQECIDELNSLN